ncbi:MAG: ABC transporter permease [Pirellulales bacterium]
MASASLSTTANSTAAPEVRLWRRLLRSRSVLWGGTIVALLIAVAIGANLLAPYGENELVGESLEAASRAHWMGTDTLRKDVLSRVIFGSRLSLLTGCFSIVVSIVIGAPLGAIAGFYGGRVDAFIMRTIDVALAFPSILLALVMAAVWKPSWETVILSVGLINVPVFARQLRASVLTMVQLDYVMASKAIGASTLRTLWREILPGLAGPLVVLASLSIGTAILEVAGLSFLGIGGDPTQPEWGTMLSQAKGYWSRNAWFALGPGLAISLSVLGFNLLGDGLRDVLDPRSDD